MNFIIISLGNVHRKLRITMSLSPCSSSIHIHTLLAHDYQNIQSLGIFKKYFLINVDFLLDFIYEYLKKRVRQCEKKTVKEKNVFSTHNNNRGSQILLYTMDGWIRARTKNTN